MMNFKDNKRIRFFKQSVALVVAAAFLFSTVIPPIAQAERIKSQNERYIQNLEQLSRQDSNLKQEISSVIAAVKDKILFAGPLIKGEDLFLLGAAQTNQSRHCFVIQFVRETRVEQAQAKSHAIRSFANEAQNKLRRESGIFWNGRSNMPHALVNFLAYLKIGPAYNLAKTEEDPKKLTLFLLKEGPFELSSDSNIEELKNLLGPLSEIIPETVGMSSSGKALIVFKENPTAKKVEEAAKKLASSNQFQVQAALKNALQKIYKAIGVRWEIVFQIPVLAVLMVWHSPWSLPAAMAVNIVQVIWFAKSHPYLQSKEKLAVGLVGLALGSVFFIPGLIQHLGWASVFPAMELHVVYNAAATIFGWPLASILLPESVKQKNKEVLAALGLSYTDFQKLTQEQESYDRNVISSEPMAAIHIASLRTQERFSKFVLEWTQKYREQGHGKKSLELARRAAEQHYYEDLIGKKSGPFAEMVARAFTTNDPVLFNQEPGSDKKLTATIQEIAQAAGSELSILYGNPFTEERQLIGHKVPKKGKDRLVYGLGELVRAVRKAQKELDQAKLEGRQPKKHILLLKNIEAMDAEVRVQLQEILRIGELTHTELGTVLLPENFQIMMTKRFGANIEDSSFYDRVIVKKAPAQTDFTPPAVEGIDSIKEEDYLNFVSLEVEGKKKYLALSPNIKIELDPKKFKDLTQENLHDEIYRQTGLVLDYETVRMLAAMESVVQSGQSILRIEGPTGLGKTFTAGGYAALRRSDFISNPVSEGTELSDWIGGFEQDKNNLFRFNGETTFKERLENGGVVALSELNTLLDINDNVKLAWWLQQIAEAKPDIKGYKIIRLTEVPAPEGEEVPVIKIHPRTLIVVDTNPENKYAARGSFPDIFKEYVPSLQVGEFVSGDGAKEKLEKAKIQRYLILFLRHDWRIDEVIKAKGIEDQNLRKQLSKSLSELYWRIVKGYIKEEFGKGEKALFSVRELKRMAEDIQYALQNGETNWEKAVGQAVKTHLVYRLSKPEDREIVAELLEKKFPSIWNQASQEPIGFSRLLKDQSLDKSRPVHIRVGAQTDLRPEIKTFKADHPNVILKIIPITNQTDRHMLEGGVVPNQEGDGTEFGHGVMGRLIQEAVAHPDQEIVYILENAHNLKPEEAVALNEILQDRKLYLKGRDTKLTLPQNAHIVLVSRSELTWSPAEQSRYVFMSYDQGNSYLADLFQKNVAPALIQKGVPRRISNNLNSLILNVYEKYQRILSYENANSSKLSNRRFARFIQRYVKRINRVPKGELTSDLLYDLSEEVFNEVFLLAFKKSEREDKKNFWAFKETYKSVDSWKEEKKKSRPQIATTKRILTPSPARALAQAQVDYLNANIHGIWENTVAAAQRIGQVAKDFSAAWRWSSISKQQLNITNLFKAIHLKQTLSEAGDGVNSVALSADGKQMVAGSWDNKVRVYELENEKWILKETLSEAGGGVNSVAMSADGSKMVAGSKDNKVRVYELENGNWILKQTLSEAVHAVFSVAMSADGSRMVSGSGDNKVRVYEPTLFMVQDESTALNLETGDPVPLRNLPDNVEKLEPLEEAQQIQTTNLENILFQPRYGDKPYYFMVDRVGKVYLNFRGNLYPTRHTLMKNWIPAGVYPTGRAEMTPLNIGDIRNPYKRGNVPLDEEDLLMETEILEEVEDSILKAFEDGWHVDLEGKAGAGKTSIAMEAALLLGLPRHKFQMHGEREISDWIGGYRENSSGQIILTSKPYIKDGIKRFRHPLLDYIVNGGLFVVDEGAIGDEGRELMSWLSSIVHGDKKVYLEEFPGRVIELDVHEDFHLIITNNSPEDTQGRSILKSEIASNLHFIHVDEDESEETLKRLFIHFLGSKTPISPEDKTLLADILVKFHLELKPRIGKDLGRDDRDRHYISKREIRRIAAQIRKQVKTPDKEESQYALYKSMRIVYEAMFPSSQEREKVFKAIQKNFARTDMQTDGLSLETILLHDDEDMSNKIRQLGLIGYTIDEIMGMDSSIVLGMDVDRVLNFKKRLDAEVLERFGGSATQAEAWTAYMTEAMFNQGEPVLYISQHGARSSDMLHSAAASIHAKIIPIDAAPEHTELEILGGLFPILNKKPGKAKRSGFVRGAILSHLATESELAELKSEHQTPVVVWIRNIDQWNEEIRTALNGFLEDGYIDIEVDEGKTERFYKPPHLHFISEIASDSTGDFSSAFFNRWIKIGVGSDSLETHETEKSDFEQVLRKVYELDPLESFYLTQLYRAILEIEENKRWDNRTQYKFGAELFFMIAEGIQLAKEEMPEWQNLLERMAQTGYDPRLHPAQAPPGLEIEQKKIWKDYRGFIQEIFTQESLRLLGARLNSKTLHSEISDLERLEKILKIILKAKRLPVVNRKFHFNSEGILTKIGGIFLKSADSAKSPLAVSKHARVRYNQEAKKALEALARASQIGRAVGFAGLPGSLKTTIANHFAEITGRKFYKYQSHGGSEYTDLTIDIEQTEDGEIRKREKELYRYLKEGNVVIVIDEANISPKILWSLLPVILGEKWVHPIFPEEPPFQIGDGVQIVFTYNPSTFSGRSEIEQRILNQMILVWMNLPDQKDRAKIIEGFYGVWTGLEDEKAMAAPEEETPASEPQKKVIVREGDVSVRNRAGSDRMMRKGMETFDPNEEIKEMPFTPLDQMPKPLARGIFEPELFPHTRHKSFNRFDENSGEMFVKDDSLDAIEIPAYSQNELKAVLKEMNRTRDLFVGTYRADLSDGGWHILPSAGAGQTILELAAFDEDGNRLNVQLETAKDSAENYYVRAVPAGSVGFVEVRYRVAVPATYFGHKVSNTLSFEYAAQIPEEVKEALGLIGLNGSETNFRAVLYKIIGYFRDFSLEENGISEDKGSIYLDVVHSKCGVCRHRAHAFARTAMAIGMETNYVETDVHAYAEINVPGVGWIRVDLGGGGDPMNMNLAPLAHEMHGPRVADDFPKPQKYREVGNQFAKRMQQAMKQQGIKPQVSNRASSGRGDGGGGGGGSTDSGDQNDQDWAQSENERIQNELEKFNKKLVEDVELNDELSALFLKGRGDTEFIFRRMFKALQSKIVTMKKAMRKGLEIDPVAFMLKKPKQFVQKKKVHKIQTTAVSVLLDFSGSMSNVKEQIGFAVASIGTNSWRLREALPQHFHYDLSYFTEGASTVVKMGERMTEGEISKRLVAMANQIGGGGTNILTSMKQKLRDFQRSPEAIQAKIKYLVIFTDGADGNSISSGQLTPAFKALLQEYREAGIDVIAIGIGQGAADVEAFNEPGQHFVKIEPNRPEDIAETIAKVAEHKLFGSGILPPGDITDFLQIGPVETNLERTKAASLLDPLLLALVRVFQRAELGGLALTLNEFRKAYNIFGAMVWEEKVFREGGLVLLPLLLNALGWNPAISLMAGILWSGPIFLFLHPFLRWLVQDQIGWMGWKAEIARELRPSFDSRLFGTILFNLVYIAASYFSMGAWQSSHPNQELPIQLAMISHFLWSAWVSLPHSLEVWKGNIKSRTDSAVSVFRSLAEPFALRASLLIPTLQASMAKEKLTPEMQTNISQITASQAQMAFPLASAPIAVFRQSFSSGFNSVKNAIAKFKLNALSPSILTKNQRRALRMADEINEKKVILIHLDEFIGDEKGFNNMMLLVKSALKEIKSSVGWSRALTYAIVFNGNRKYVEKAEIELEIKANVIVNKPEDYAALKTRDENLKNASEWIIAAQSQTSLWSHLLHSRNAMIFEILDVGVNLRVNGALGARIANLKGFDANNVIEKHGDHILIKGRRLEDFNTNELIKNIRSLEQFQTSQ